MHVKIQNTISLTSLYLTYPIATLSCIRLVSKQLYRKIVVETRDVLQIPAVPRRECRQKIPRDGWHYNMETTAV